MAIVSHVGGIFCEKYPLFLYINYLTIDNTPFLSVSEAFSDTQDEEGVNIFTLSLRGIIQKEQERYQVQREW